MTMHAFIAPSALAIAVLMSAIPSARTAELKALAGGGIASPLRELAPQFERVAGHKIAFQFGTTPELIKLATSGEPFDLAVAPSELFEDNTAAARFVFWPRARIARVGLGVAVRAGAPKPDISTPDALKETLLGARSIATIPASAAGALVLRALERLGVSVAMKAKTKAVGSPPQIVEAVASGDAELGLFLTNTLIAPGIDLVGPFPPEVQQEVFYIAAVAASSTRADAAKAFLAFLTTPAAAAVIKAKGMEPAAR
jgi:molybdate transport system substrate-binding protein